MNAAKGEKYADACVRGKNGKKKRTKSPTSEVKGRRVFGANRECDDEISAHDGLPVSPKFRRRLAAC